MIINTFQKKLLEKKLKERNDEVSSLAKSLPKKYIDSGVLDSQFIMIYSHGAGADQDAFGREFAKNCLKYALEKINKSPAEEHLGIVRNLGLALSGLVEHVFENVMKNLEHKLSDPISGIKNNTQLYGDFNSHVQTCDSYFAGKKKVIDNLFKPKKIRLVK